MLFVIFLLTPILLTSTGNALFQSKSIRTLLANKDRFCPKKHFKAIKSCFMYFLTEENFDISQRNCKNFSDDLVMLKSEFKWNELTTKLKQFPLENYTFKIGLLIQNNQRYWIDGSNDTAHLKWCNNGKNFA